MNDSTQYHFEDKEPKRKNKLPLVLLIIAIILGLIIWRFKNSSRPVEVAAPSKDTVSITAPAPETVKPDTTPAPAPVAAAVKPEHAAKHHKAETQASVSEPAAVAEVPKPEPKAKPAKAQPPVQVPSSVSPMASKEPVVAPTPKEPAATPAPAKVEPKTQAVSKPAEQPPKKFALKDQPMPDKTALSEEGRVAMTTLPKAEAQSEAAAASPAASDAFKQGQDAYHKQDYTTAIKVLGQLPKPVTKQRGNPARDEYVEGNFLLGLSYLRADRANDAVNAFLTVLNFEKYYPLANMNLGICYVELKQYFKANKAFEAVVRDQGYIDAAIYDDVMQRTKYFWAIAWTRMYKTSRDADKQAFYQQQAVQKWKDYQTWFGKNAKYRTENRKAEDYIKSLSAM